MEPRVKRTFRFLQDANLHNNNNNRIKPEKNNESKEEDDEECIPPTPSQKNTKRICRPTIIIEDDEEVISSSPEPSDRDYEDPYVDNQNKRKSAARKETTNNNNRPTNLRNIGAKNNNNNVSKFFKTRNEEEREEEERIAEKKKEKEKARQQLMLLILNQKQTFYKVLNIVDDYWNRTKTLKDKLLLIKFIREWKSHYLKYGHLFSIQVKAKDKEKDGPWISIFQLILEIHEWFLKVPLNLPYHKKYLLDTLENNLQWKDIDIITENSFSSDTELVNLELKNCYIVQPVNI
jgi:hypothetical protein